MPTADDTTTTAPLTLPTTTPPAKPGWKTSEFWMASAAILLTLAYASGLIPTVGLAATIAAMAAKALISAGYSVGRAITKTGAAALLVVMFVIASSQTACTAAQKTTATTAAVSGYDCAKADLEQILASNGLTVLETVYAYLRNTSDTTALRAELAALAPEAKADAIACAVRAGSQLVAARATTAAAASAGSSMSSRAADVIALEGWTYR